MLVGVSLNFCSPPSCLRELRKNRLLRDTVLLYEVAALNPIPTAPVCPLSPIANRIRIKVYRSNP
jgi:hypothetical protein